MTQLVPTGGLQSTSTSNIFKPKQIWTPLFLIPSINAWVQSFWVTTNPNIIETWYHQNISSCLAWKVIPFLVWWSPKRESSGLFAGLPLITWFGLLVWGFGVRLNFPFSFREYWVAVTICYLSQFGDWSGTLTMIRQAQQGNGVISFNLLRRCKANNWKIYEDDAAPKVGKKIQNPKVAVGDHSIPNSQPDMGIDKYGCHHDFSWTLGLCDKKILMSPSKSPKRIETFKFGINSNIPPRFHCKLCFLKNQVSRIVLIIMINYMRIIYIYTPWKINMEPTNHQFRKENDLPNLHDYVPC